MKLDRRIAAAVLVLSIAACGGDPQASSALSGRQPRSSAAQGGGGGGGAQVPPPPTVDGPAWYIYNASAGVEWFPVKNVGLVLAYGVTNIDLARQSSTAETRVKVKLHGPSAFLKARF